MIRPFVHYAFRVTNNLYVGNKRSANELLFLVSNQITTIVNCAALEISIVNPNINVICFKWLDTEDQLIVVSENINLVYEAIENSDAKGESVLICCLTGQSRSIAIVAAYLMKKFSWNLKSVVQYLQICRNGLEIREGYLFQLSLYEKTLSKKTQTDNIHEETLLKQTYFNAKLGKIWQKNKLNDSIYRFKQKKRTKKISWSPQLITYIKVNYESYDLTNAYLQDFLVDDQNNKTQDFSELIQKSKSYFLSKRSNNKHSKGKNQVSKSKNQSPLERLPNVHIKLIPERSVSVTSEMKPESNCFASNRKNPTKGEMILKYNKGIVQFRMK